MFAKQYSRYYEVFNQDKNRKKEIDFVYKWAGTPATVLDIGCGTANYWKHFPEGTIVHGIEKSEYMASRSPWAPRIVVADIATMAVPCIKRAIPDTFANLFDIYDSATAIFDVINYLPDHKWWKYLPIKTGGYFIFDVWDKTKVDAEGFKETLKRFGGISRRIIPLGYNGQAVDLRIEIFDNGITLHERHRMFVYSRQEIEDFCGDDFLIVDVKKTKDWQTWYRLQKK